MRCVVWTGVYAAGFLQVRAKIAGGCLLLDDRLLAAGILRIVRKNFEGMQIDIAVGAIPRAEPAADADRKSTRLNSSHVAISYAVFCLKKKKTTDTTPQDAIEILISTR